MFVYVPEYIFCVCLLACTDVKLFHTTKSKSRTSDMPCICDVLGPLGGATFVQFSAVRCGGGRSAPLSGHFLVEQWLISDIISPLGAVGCGGATKRQLVPTSAGAAGRKMAVHGGSKLVLPFVNQTQLWQKIVEDTRRRDVRELLACSIY